MLTRIAHAALAAWGHQDTSWTLPPHVRALYQQVDRPPVHGWGDRRPTPDDTATVVITWARQGLPAATLAGAVAHAPTPFQQRALHVVNHAIDDAMGASTSGPFLPLAMSGGDSVIVQIRFGMEPRPGDGVARFAVVYRPIEEGTPRLRPEYPEVARQSDVEAVVRVAYVVDRDGRVDSSTVRVIEAPYREFVDAVKSALSRARWSPLQLDCVAYSAVVLQEFNFNLRP